MIKNLDKPRNFFVVPNISLNFVKIEIKLLELFKFISFKK